MKKPVIFILLMLAGLVCCRAQSPDGSQTIVHYNLSQVIDTTQRDIPKTDDIVLFIGKQASLCTSYGAIQAEARLKDFAQKNPTVILGGRTENYGIPYTFYKDMAGKKSISLALFQGTNYAIEENLPEQDWKITTETKNIQGHACQKAITFFRGRSYEAWFCSDLPYRNGPWKLGGLPGLIMEVYDVKKEVMFTFKSIEENAAQQTPIALPTPVIKTTTKELKRAVDAVFNDQAAKQPGVMALSQTSANGAPAKRREYNNPIEKDVK